MTCIPAFLESLGSTSERKRSMTCCVQDDEAACKRSMTCCVQDDEAACKRSVTCCVQDDEAACKRNIKIATKKKSRRTQKKERNYAPPPPPTPPQPPPPQPPPPPPHKQTARRPVVPPATRRWLELELQEIFTQLTLQWLAWKDQLRANAGPIDQFSGELSVNDAQIHNQLQLQYSYPMTQSAHIILCLKSPRLESGNTWITSGIFHTVANSSEPITWRWPLENAAMARQVRIENMTDEAILVFGNFIFGGTKEWSTDCVACCERKPWET